MGLFITIEGGEGTGKTTVMSKVVEKLEKDGLDILKTRNPGGTEIGKEIRSIVLSKEDKNMSEICEVLLFAADRAQQVQEIIIPNITDKIIICDRFFDSSIVYQGIMGNMGIDKVYELNMVATKGLVPDLTLLFDLDPIIGQQRIASNKDREVNRFDMKSLEYHQKVRNAYLEVANRFKDRIVIIDASRTVEETVAEVYKIIKNKVKGMK